MRRFYIAAFLTLCFAQSAKRLSAQEMTGDPCFRPKKGSVVTQPEDLRSSGAVLKVNLAIRSYAEKDGSAHYCYIDANGQESPTLRVKPGDLVILTLKNELTDQHARAAAATSQHDHMHVAPKETTPCTSGLMTSLSTNLHFHGLEIPPTCHQDDVLRTSVQPNDPPFQYRFRVPEDQPPGLYWYHPHIHGFTKVQVLGGASGAIIVEGIERANTALAGLPERVLIIRDQDLLNPNAPPLPSESVAPGALSDGGVFDRPTNEELDRDEVTLRRRTGLVKSANQRLDREGDAANNGTGLGKPAKDLSINFVPVPYPDYPPALIQIKPGARELWRMLNASAITYLDLQILFNQKPQPLGLVALDGVPLNEDRTLGNFVSWQTHLGVPPGARVEFIVKAPTVGVSGLLVTRAVDTGPGGENDPNRALATITASDDAPELPAKLDASPTPLPPPPMTWLGDVVPVRTRKLYFSEKLLDPNNPSSATEFYLTVDGQQPAPFDPKSGVPNIIVKQGTVEDWIIENRSSEVHAFHIHQLHFLLLYYVGRRVNEPFLRDTVSVPYYDGDAIEYPRVRLRMDFRDPNIVGDFVYHCHLLEHEDKGMMGIIRVEPGDDAKGAKAKLARGSH